MIRINITIVEDNITVAKLTGILPNTLANELVTDVTSLAGLAYDVPCARRKVTPRQIITAWVSMLEIYQTVYQTCLLAVNNDNEYLFKLCDTFKITYDEGTLSDDDSSTEEDREPEIEELQKMKNNSETTSSLDTDIEFSRIFSFTKREYTDTSNITEDTTEFKFTITLADTSV